MFIVTVKIKVACGSERTAIQMAKEQLELSLPRDRGAYGLSEGLDFKVTRVKKCPWKPGKEEWDLRNF